MTKENAREFLPLVQAMADGKTVQVNTIGGWKEVEAFSFGSHPSDYRIKPEPKLRAWTASEVPVGKLYRRKSWPETDPQSKSLIIGVSYGKIAYYVSGSGFACDGLSEALEYAEHSLDSGVTWHPCGILES